MFQQSPPPWGGKISMRKLTEGKLRKRDKKQGGRTKGRKGEKGEEKKGREKREEKGTKTRGEDIGKEGR